MAVRDTPQTKTQHAVPQNVMDVEFKLIGDLTLRQFGYLTVLGVIAYVSYISVIGIFKLPLTIFFALLGLGLAFGSYQERGMDVWITSFIKAMYQPTQRVWRKEPEIPQAFLQARLDVVKRELITLAPTSSRRKLEKFLEYGIGEEDRDPLDIPEAEYIMKVRTAFANSEPVPVQAPPPAQAARSPAVGVTAPPIPSGVSKEPEKEKHGGIFHKHPKPEEKDKPVEKVAERPVEKPKTLQMPSRPVKSAKPSDHYVPLEVITPDRHSGRRFSRILPSDGEIILPIRGEKVIKTTFEQDVDNAVKEKTEQLQELLDQIKGSGDSALGNKNISKPQKPIQSPVINKKVELKPEVLVDKAKHEDKKLLKNIAKIEEELEKTKKNAEGQKLDDNKSRMLEEKLRRSNEEYENLHKQLNELQERIKPDTSGDTLGAKPVPASSVTASGGKIGRVFTHAPNVLSGIVRDSKGGVQEGVLLLVKDSHGDPVRAFKTNKLGEFLLSTPLDNGMYTIEVSESNNLDLTFDIISIEVTGNVVPPLQLIGS